MHLKVLDKNDNAPQFIENPLVAVMKAATYSANKEIVQIFAHDDDQFNTSVSERNVDFRSFRFKLLFFSLQASEHRVLQ